MDENQKPAYDAEAFKHWILSQKHEEYEIEQKDHRHILFKNQFGTAEINFYEQDIVEISITSLKDHENKFWLHFQLSEEEHAKQLFSEMVEAFLSLKEDHRLKVLLCCSSGFTSSFFADKLNEAAASLEIHCEFHAVSCYSIYEEGPGYDMILIAPQIGYMAKKLQSAFSEIPVVQLPTAVFASYDAMKALKFIEQEQQDFLEKKRLRQRTECSCYLKSRKTLLAIAFRIEDKTQTNVYYRLYADGKVILDDMVKKKNLDYSDLKDIMDTVLAQNVKLDLISIAAPGIAQNNILLHFKDDFSKPFQCRRKLSFHDLGFWFAETYQIRTFVCNNTNAAALGFYKAHPEYRNIIYHSQPFALPGGGQGYIIDGTLHRGKNGISGEFKFHLSRMQFSDDLKKLAKTDQGMLEIVTKALLPAITVIGPDAVAIKSPMTSDMQELKNKISSFLPPEYLPEFIYVADDREYLLNGQAALALEQLKKENREAAA